MCFICEQENFCEVCDGGGGMAATAELGKEWVCGNCYDPELDPDHEDNEDETPHFMCCGRKQCPNGCALCDRVNTCEICNGEGGDWGKYEEWVCGQCYDTKHDINHDDYIKFGSDEEYDEFDSDEEEEDKAQYRGNINGHFHEGDTNIIQYFGGTLKVLDEYDDWRKIECSITRSTFQEDAVLWMRNLEEDATNHIVSVSFKAYAYRPKDFIAKWKLKDEFDATDFIYHYCFLKEIEYFFNHTEDDICMFVTCHNVPTKIVQGTSF